jgi:DNA mismatch repair protein MSH5
LAAKQAKKNLLLWLEVNKTRLMIYSLQRTGPNIMCFNNLYFVFLSVIDMDNVESLSSLGALLAYLQENIMNLENGMMYVSKLSSITLESYMRLTTGTQKALQIFQTDYHPNVIKGPGRSKEGFSVFAMLDRTTSSVGRACLKVWMSRPLCDKEKILSRQDGIEVLMRNENQDYVTNISKILKKVHDMPKLILRIKKVVASYKEWCNLLSALRAALQIFEEISAFSHHVTKDIDKRFIYGLFAPHDVQTLRNVFSALQAAIDIEASLNAGELVIVSGYSAELDKLSDIYNNLETFLTEAARSILESAPLLNHVAVEYVPQIGYLAAIGMEDTHFLNPEEFKLVYEMDQTGYFKCDRLYEMDDSIGDIKANISDLKNKILLVLEEIVLEAEGSVVEISAGIGTLDATLSLANVALSMNFVRPDISEESVVIIKNGRHPLSELTVDVFVPNDTYLTSEMNVALITGYALFI